MDTERINLNRWSFSSTSPSPLSRATAGQKGILVSSYPLVSFRTEFGRRDGGSCWTMFVSSPRCHNFTLYLTSRTTNMYAPKYNFYNPLVPYFPLLSVAFVYIYVLFTHFLHPSQRYFRFTGGRGQNCISAPRPNSRGARCSHVCVPAKSKSRRTSLCPNS